jgi:uracil-DNA glycosylase family 4
MSVPLELDEESLASRLSVEATSAFVPVKPALEPVELPPASEQPPSSRDSDAAAMTSRRLERTEQSLRERRLAKLAAEIESCRRCPRLVQWREQVAREKRAAYAGEDYWGRPLAGFGDRAARIAIFGLAPAAHGGNRTGRVFTGDRSGDFLFAALHRVGLADRPESIRRDDGLRVSGAWICAAVRCAPPANRPTPSERDNCLPYTREEFALLWDLRVIVCLGAFAWAAATRLLTIRPRPRFAHGAEYPGSPALLASFHVSQQNTFTGRLTEAMLDEVLERAKRMAQLPLYK